MPGTFENYVGEWAASANSLFTVQSTFDGNAGTRYTYYGTDFASDIPAQTYGPAVEVGTVLNLIELAPGEQVRIRDAVGVHDNAGTASENGSVTTAVESRLTVQRPEPEPEPQPEPGECEDVDPVNDLLFAATGSTLAAASVGSTGSMVTSSLFGLAAGSLAASSDDGCATGN